ncbi:hypothetical protein [Salinibacter ruber]|nr:hypothetical protein [Salinibacter ruber]
MSTDLSGNLKKEREEIQELMQELRKSNRALIEELEKSSDRDSGGE